ncbi:MAG TPA: ABC transporter ATP-binding protein [Steroidobacteraceae bacterium]|nr:ABC transporter ATP-binding protein [Steroidobacteraceae bacterium]
MSTPLLANAFSLQGVSKTFSYFKLESLTLSLPQGQIMGLVGPNGAGKSTTIRLLMGLAAADGGTIEALGYRIPKQVEEAKRAIAFVSDDMRLFPGATLAWHMRFVASIYPAWDQMYAEQLLKRFNLRPPQSVAKLSRGEHVKALLLLALARRPALLVLDEPTSGLDPVARHELLTELMEIVADDKRSILFSSHNTQDVERICDQIAFIDRGRLVDSRDKEAFLERWRRISVDVPTGVVLPRLADVVDLSLGERVAMLTTDNYLPQMHALLEHGGARVRDVQRMSLEEIFVACVMRSRAQEPS